LSKKVEFGDWQTPKNLAETVTKRVRGLGIYPKSILEPTCGTGAFVASAIVEFPEAQKILGIEINAMYLDEAKESIRKIDNKGVVELRNEDFFLTDWNSLLGDLEGEVLILGNLPWVTNATQGALGSENLPEKTNFRGLSGLDARTGKSNFDISEWMVLELLKSISERDATVALLLKTSVARKLIAFGEETKLPVLEAQMIRLDAMKHFEAAVDACLFIMRLSPGIEVASYDYKVFESFEDVGYKIFGHRNGNTVSNIDAFEKHAFLGTGSPQKWRSGIKHDCSGIMELSRVGDELKNTDGDIVRVEEEFLFPLLKGSDVANRRPWRGKYVVVTQKNVGEETASLEKRAPKLWSYLSRHAEKLDNRKSSIYLKNPRFSIFGVGEYSFMPYKIAICGLYKKLTFELIEPIGGKPVMFDDTVYFLGFESKKEADGVLAALEKIDAQEFLSSLIFWDEKRPIKTSVLNQLDWTRVR
jgi:hypothetical protein